MNLTEAKIPPGPFEKKKMDPKQRVDTAIAEGKKCGQSWWVILCDPETELERPGAIGMAVMLIAMQLAGIALMIGSMPMMVATHSLWLFLASITLGAFLCVFPMEDAQWDARFTKPKGKAKEIWDYCAKNRLNPRMEKMWVDGHLTICIKISW